MSKLTKNMDVIMGQGKSLLEFYRLNPCIAAYELLGVDLASIQRVVFEDMWFKPYTLVVAGRGAGKSKNTNELTHIKDKGLVYLHEFLPPIPGYLKDGEDEVIDYNESIYTSEGFRNINKLALEKGIIGKKITTQNMYETSGSDQHPMLTIDNKGELVYKRTDTFKVGDRICIQRDQQVFGTTKYSKKIIEHIAISMVLNKQYNKNSYMIRTSDKESQIYFLQYLYQFLRCDTDNTITNVKNKNFFKELQLLLLNFGIVTTHNYIYLKPLPGNDYLLLKNILNHGVVNTTVVNYYYDTVTSIEDWKGDCYDFEMDMLSNVEPNYFSNGFINHNTFLSGVLAALLSLLYPGYRTGLIGPSFRQSKMIFSEVEKLYTQSSILREATVKRPIRGSDTCYLEFRSVAGHNPSRIESLPIGADGAKIRGSRFYCILVDEFAQVPQKIIETVLAPMSITKLDPMKKVRELERKTRLIEAGLATDADFEEDSVNKMIGTSSGYYKFNHMYRRMREYWSQIDEGSKDHSVFQIPYTLLPEGFLDPKNVENARRVMSDHEFRMEYMADMVSDSEGFFKASILEDCTIGSNFKVELNGDKLAKYIIGIDPNQGGSAKCGVVIIKLGPDFNKVVRVLALDGKTTQDITMALQGLCKSYNVLRIYMDRGGGGKAVCDLLEEGYNDEEPILDRENKDNIKKQGRHILEVIAFSTSWISDANFATLSLLEDKKVRFPEKTLAKSSKMDTEDREQDRVEELKKQCVSIIVTQTASGALHFDTPKKGQNKDLYSAFILAGYGVKALERESEEEEDNELYNGGGMVRSRDSASPFRAAVLGSNSNTTNVVIGKATLKRRIK